MCVRVGGMRAVPSRCWADLEKKEKGRGWAERVLPVLNMGGERWTDNGRELRVALGRGWVWPWAGVTCDPGRRLSVTLGRGWVWPWVEVGCGPGRELRVTLGGGWE